jgi:beta-glucanase (GH16 family)
MKRLGVPLLLMVSALLPLLLMASALLPAYSADATRLQPRGVGGQWRLVFRDEFNGDRLNLQKWRPNWLGRNDRSVTEPVNDVELSCYDPRNVHVDHGKLRLTAERRRCPADGETYDYASGLVQSSDDYRFRYGFLQARIYLPPSDGSLAPKGSCGPNWANFWTNGLHRARGWPQDGEIDVVECLADNEAAWYYHAPGIDASGFPAAWRDDMPGTGGWHTFGVNWRPGRLTYYFDGVKVGRVTRNVTDSVQYIVVNLAVSGSAIKVPQTIRIDYIRLWKSVT